MTPGTTSTAIYMPTRTLAELVAKAVAQGLDPATPAIAVARATRPDQQAIHSAVGELPRRLAAAGLPGPVLVMLGQSIGRAEVRENHGVQRQRG